MLINSYDHHLHLGFSAVNKSCVCNAPHHLVYWRPNFDEKELKKEYREDYNGHPISGQSN
jgi:hypothetical protein